MASELKAPSLVALAAAFRSLELAATHVRGVCEWVDRLEREEAQVTADEAVRLWTFAERTRAITSALEQDVERLTGALTARFLTEDGNWPLTPEQEQEYREVLATLASREAEGHRGALDQPPEP
jgi:hypothetical protein